MTIGRITGALAVGVAALGLASAVYQAAGEIRDRRRRQPPGRLVDVGGYRLHILCAGQRSPAVVIVPALGATVDDWREVQQRIAEETTVCVYDRAGLGYSDSPLSHRTARRMAEELHALLRGAGIAPPYVLAGHSLGGLVTRVFTRLYPEEVAGVALIEASHPAMQRRLPKTFLWQHPGGPLLVAALGRAYPLGLRRLARDLGLYGADGIGWSRQRRAGEGELLALKAICREAGRMVGDLGDMPLAVVTADEMDPNLEPGSRTQRALSRFYRGWIVLQHEMAALSADSTHVVAEHGGHHLNHDNPELVAQAVTDLVRRVRSRASAA
jgi:pimeloyl-ACP methyl ester carboxylesterase